MALQLEQVVAGGDLDDGRHVAAGAHRHDEHRDLDVEDPELLLLHAEPIVLDVRVPLDELEHDLDLLPLADGRDAEEVLDVDDPEPADLHVVLDDLGPGAEHRLGRLPLHVDDVVGDEAVAAHDEVERDLALADAGLAEQQDADPEDVEQHAVHRGLHRLDEVRGEVRRAQERHAGVLGRGDHLRRRVEPLRHDEARDVLREERVQHVDRALARERREVADLGVAEHLHPLLVQVLGEPGEHEPRLLDAGRADPAREPLLARDERQPEIEFLVVEERPDADRVHSGGV